MKKQVFIFLSCMAFTAITGAQVVLYKTTDFKGDSMVVSQTQDLPVGWNDNVKSIKVPSGLSITLLEHYQDFELSTSLKETITSNWTATGKNLAGKVSCIIFNIPELSANNSTVNLSEGAINPSTAIKTTGNVKALMIFLEFSDVTSADSNIQNIVKNLLGDGKAQKLFSDQSYGKMTLTVEQQNPAVWKRMPRRYSEYKTGNNVDYSRLMQDAVNQFPAINFKKYDLLYIVFENGSIPISPSHYNETTTKDGNIYHIVTLGTDSYTNPYKNLVHETGHRLGLPDLYPYEPYPSLAPIHKVGPWDVMGMMNVADGFFGWHRHKMGWLDNNRKRYFPVKGTYKVSLSHLNSSKGVSMVAVPVKAAAGQKVSKVYVVELTETIFAYYNGTGPTPWSTNTRSPSEGVLIYSVDASISSGRNPVVVYSKQRLATDADLWNAPFNAVNDVFNPADAPMSVKITEKQGTGANATYTVEITVK